MYSVCQRNATQFAQLLDTGIFTVTRYAHGWGYNEKACAWLCLRLKELPARSISSDGLSTRSVSGKRRFCFNCLFEWQESACLQLQIIDKVPRACIIVQYSTRPINFVQIPLLVQCSKHQKLSTVCKGATYVCPAFQS